MDLVLWLMISIITYLVMVLIQWLVIQYQFKKSMLALDIFLNTYITNDIEYWIASRVFNNGNFKGKLVALDEEVNQQVYLSYSSDHNVIWLYQTVGMGLLFKINTYGSARLDNIITKKLDDALNRITVKEKDLFY